MKKAVIICTFNDEVRKEEIPIENDTPMYAVADMAFAFALMFAQGQPKVMTDFELGQVLEKIDYTYEVEDI